MEILFANGSNFLHVSFTLCTPLGVKSLMSALLSESHVMAQGFEFASPAQAVLSPCTKKYLVYAPFRAQMELKAGARSAGLPLIYLSSALL